MANLNPKNKLSTDTLLQAAANLNSNELENFVNQAILVRAKRRASNIRKQEAELLLEINRGLSPELQKRFDELAEKLAAENMTFNEREEFLTLTDQIEKQDAKRIGLLGKLAEIRQISIDDLMRELQIGQS